MPTSLEQFDDARADFLRAARAMQLRISPICCSIVCSGLSEVIGSWNTMVILRAANGAQLGVRERQNVLAGEDDAVPKDGSPAGGSSRTIDSAVIDLPEPDSPTSASVRPRSQREGDFVDGERLRAACEKAMERSRTSRRGRWSCDRSPERLSRIEGVAHRLADEDQQREHQRDDDEAGEAEPGRLQVGFALQQQFAERRRARRQAEARGSRARSAS